MAWCEEQIKLNLPQDDGFTGRQHLSSAYPDDPLLWELAPCGLHYVWDYWAQLDAARGSSGFAISPISYTDIYAWSSVCKDVYVSSQTVRLIIKIDQIYRREVSDWNKGGSDDR